MLRHLLKNTVSYRCLSLLPVRQNKIEDFNFKGESGDTANNDSPQHENRTPLVEQVTLNPTIYKPITAMPFAELNHPSKDSEMPSDLAEFIDTLGPPLPVSFNLASYVNRSESLQKLVQLGVDLSLLEQKPEKAKFILKLDFEKDMKTHIQFLHDHGVDADFLGRFITKNPFIFKETIENLEIRINYLKSKKFTNEAISRIIGHNPFFLSIDTKTVDSRLGFFQKQFSLSGNQVRYLIAKSPTLVSYPFMKFTEKLFAMKEEFGFNSSEMKTILLKKPKVWIIGRKLLRERFDILHNIMGLPHERIVAFPGVMLTRGFILRQRHQYLVHLNRAQYDPKQPLYISLEDLATTTDSVFCERCAKTSVEEYNEFLRTL